MAVSTSPTRGYDFLDTFADDVAALIDALELSDLTLIAHSIAGGEAVRYLTRHGKEMRRARHPPCATTPMLLKTDDNPNGALSPRSRRCGRNGSATIRNGSRTTSRRSSSRRTSPAMMRWGAGLLQTPVPIALACARAMVAEDFRAEMRRKMFQTLIVHGDRDRSAA